MRVATQAKDGGGLGIVDVQHPITPAKQIIKIGRVKPVQRDTGGGYLAVQHFGSLVKIGLPERTDEPTSLWFHIEKGEQLFIRRLRELDDIGTRFIH